MRHVPLLLLLPLLRGASGAVEHHVSREDAFGAAQDLHPELDPRPLGCGACTQHELRYCEGKAVLYDHCCCDMRYHEAFPYMPHTCYLTQDPCKVQAGDCEEYTRLRTCCCDHILRARYILLVAEIKGGSTLSQHKFNEWQSFDVLPWEQTSDSWKLTEGKALSRSDPQSFVSMILLVLSLLTSLFGAS